MFEFIKKIFARKKKVVALRPMSGAEIADSVAKMEESMEKTKKWMANMPKYQSSGPPPWTPPFDDNNTPPRPPFIPGQH